MSRETAETREDLFLAPSLFELLCKKIADDYRRRWANSLSGPPPLLLGFSLAISVVLLFIYPHISYVFFGLTLVQGIWAGVVAAMRSHHDIDAKEEQLRQGEFMPENRDLILNHLRWWNHLLVPQQWAKHSRVFELEKRLQKKVADAMARVTHLESPEGQEELAEQERAREAEAEQARQEKQLKDRRRSRGLGGLLFGTPVDEKNPKEEEAQQQPTAPETVPSDPAELASRINTIAQRSFYRARIDSIQDPVEKAKAEMVLFQSYLIKVEGVTEKLKRIEELSVNLKEGEKAALNDFVPATISRLEERRGLISQVDRISPSDLMQLTNV